MIGNMSVSLPGENERDIFVRHASQHISSAKFSVFGSSLLCH